MFFFQEKQDFPGWEERGENVMKTLNTQFGWKRVGKSARTLPADLQTAFV